ncbi:uncharacterized protein LOC114245708 [Bombyx mandarina]|uniref:Uncharacterized protein LOC114245708 n=1 Tax=Bombyx mandarina TaxID=7092 RepID=A0A6J2JVA7_BOMMA|nr:uncharacterized protein LOC114245708 [Bombyx mandarina]
MDSPKIVYKYYSNPAFCSQSEVVFQKACVTKIVAPDRPRMPPLGGNSPRKIEVCNRIVRTDISDNPIRMSPAGRNRDEPPELPPKPLKYQPRFQRQASLVHKPTRRVRCRTRSEDLEMAQFKQERNSKLNITIHNDGVDTLKDRYEIIRDMDDFDYSPTKKRIVEADPSEIEEYNVDGPDENELKEIPTEIVKTVNGRTHRYAIVPTDDVEPVRKNAVTFSSPVMSQQNLIATQKLHELLSTPRKLRSYPSQPSVRITPNKNQASPIKYGTPQRMVSSTPTDGVARSRSCANLTLSRNTSPISPKAQQKLSYGIGDDADRPDVFVTSIREKSRDSFERDLSRESRRERRRDKNTAVIVPRVAPPPSTISEDTYKSISSLKTTPGTASLTIATLILTLCGGLSTGLSFYMMYAIGRKYYLDFSVLSGFTCFILGLLGFRSKRHRLLPNRNYVSGYIVLSSFSLLSAFGLLVLLSVQPKSGTPLSDITSGAVCAVSVLALGVACLGAVVSYCCASDPPDNRVASVRY